MIKLKTSFNCGRTFSFAKNKKDYLIFLVENDAKNDEYVGFGCCDYCLIGLSYFIGLLTFPIFVIMSIKIVKEYERAVIMRLGRINGGAKGPGLFWVLPCTDTIQIVDLRTVTFDVPPQEILTKDSVTVAVDAVCYFRTYNPVVSVTQAENATYSTRLLAATTLRNILGLRTLQEILQEKEAISHQMQEHLGKKKERKIYNLNCKRRKFDIILVECDKIGTAIF